MTRQQDDDKLDDVNHWDKTKVHTTSEKQISRIFQGQITVFKD